MQSFLLAYGRLLWIVAALVLALAVGIGVNWLRASKHRRTIFIVGAVVVVVGGAVLVWAVPHETPPPCAGEITEVKSLGYLQPQLEALGYSPADAHTFHTVNYVKEDEYAWPTYIFYFTGTKAGKTQGVSAVGNGCGLRDLEEMSKPFTITKMD